MEDTADITNTDNLEDVQNVNEPDNTDNSKLEQSYKPDETDNNADNNNSNELILGKFKTQDDLIKAYSELEQNQGKKSQEYAELKAKAEIVDNLQKKQQELAELYGFNNVDELQTSLNQKKVDTDLANFVADEYAKHINKVEYPDEMRNLLLQYKQNPDNEVLSMIKNEFPIEIIEQVAVSTQNYKGQLEQLKNQALEKQEYERAEQYLQSNIAKYNEERYFQNQEFKNIYTELFKAFGTDLNTDYAIEQIEKYVQARIQLNYKQQKMKTENDNITNNLNGFQDDSVSHGAVKSVLDMTPEELSLALRTTYKK